MAASEVRTRERRVPRVYPGVAGPLLTGGPEDFILERTLILLDLFNFIFLVK